jgi:hypothetical protein
MQTGSSGTLIGWKSGQTTFVPLWDQMEGAWLRTLVSDGGDGYFAAIEINEFPFPLSKQYIIGDVLTNRQPAANTPGRLV